MRSYFDYAATCPLHPQVLAAYTAELAMLGNPASLHAEGQGARMRLESARIEVAAALGARTPQEVIFTSGGTEADNLAIKGIYFARNRDRARPRVLLSAIEHHAVLESAEALEAHGAELVYLPVTSAGELDLEAAQALLAQDPERTSLVSVMLANNEIGTLQPVAGLARHTHALNVPIHTDAVQAVGQVPVDFAQLGVDAMSVSAHKLGAPVGIGALLATRELKLIPTAHGGGQERQVRSGTSDVAGAAAFAVALNLAVDNLGESTAHMRELRDWLIATIEDTVPGAVLSGPRGDARLPGNVHFSYAGCEGDSLLFLLDVAGFATSTGSACQAGVSRPSHVMLACGESEARARGTQRFSLGARTTRAEVEALAAALPQIVERARRAGMASGEGAYTTGVSGGVYA